ncbi:MAG TPA: hypothetical protein VN457_00525, partial [Chlamydiales bacterium]|nr:hypothetical protein [Chlamydiales bacterium]
LKEEKIQPHKTTKAEIANLFTVVNRDLKDATIKELSLDRRFATAYNAALQLASIVLYASGYRAKAAVGHHWVTLQILPELMGRDMKKRTSYFNACRSKRNVTDYDFAGSISDIEVAELFSEVRLFHKEVLSWLQKHHSSLTS